MTSPLSIEATLALLEDVERGAMPPEYRGKRYVTMHGFDVTVMRDKPPKKHPLARKPERFALRVVGEGADLGEALRALWSAIEATYVDFGRDPKKDGMTGPWTANLALWLREGPFSVPRDDRDAARNFALHRAASMFPEARFVVAVYGDAPYEGEAACILELPAGPAEQKPK
ncbi:hypothetical protein [Polyangium aurulentum]|uniref:hypothetical protein n=1 Tax=Polyangium aurulentum TaxID=2567896 RepID=UPI0010AE5743|nr:hypothetical protein [Polyangium aurulentum]UQA58399.1 hypothetical protein E8A73_045340 [Polyangium aurulentum]